ncbi:MAG: ribosomal assembly protein [Methanothermococcus sp.]|jgi:ribosomal RNA assembly protein|uniref:KH domain-containing protein n=1 Tax=Methanothermococcus TaxID=155862 RepID=UPI00036F182E|nr:MULTISPECIES: KH domain-containing protein [Methanothermococcus]MDK2791023.1 ribosomal assembly protein [Methanothermococcus sp.]MDK2987895.1 ribosomal assembly protein [Methanothermococcus sp.]
MYGNVEVVKIPKNRIAILIGKGGETKKGIEEKLGVELDIGDDGEVTIFSTEKQEDALATWKARDIVKAVGRGFNPEKALKLVSDQYLLEIIDITEYATSDSAIKRLKGRVIGSGGKSRKYIEDLTGTDLSIFGKTVAILGEFESVQTAKEAVEMILRGTSHAKMYKYLERQRQKIKRKELELWKK